MSIPLVQNNEKDSINTSIIAIKRNIERINMLLGLVDNDSPDLSGFATKQELQDAVTELQPVDEVTVGNLHSVTSNAVANYTVNSVSSGNTRPVTSGAVADSLSVKLPVLLFTETNNTSAIRYYKVNAIFPCIFGEVVYFMQARAGELIVISAGHGDGYAYETPKAKRLLDTYSKIGGLRYNGSVLYFSLFPYSHEVVFTKMSGTWDLTRSSAPVQEVSAAEYSAATAITIET